MAPTTVAERRGRGVRCPRTGIVLTPLKVRVLTTAFLARATCGRHYRHLFASVKTRNECLRKLYDHGYLDRFFEPAHPFGAPLYGIGKKGVPVAVAALQAQGLEMTREMVRAIARKPAQMEHALRTADVYEALCLRREGADEAAIGRFLPEQAVRFDYEVRAGEGQRWRRRCFAPDGAVIATVGATACAIFLEIDMATVELSRFAAKLDAFGHVRDAGLAKDRTGCGEAVLAVATVSEQRARRLLSLARDRQAGRVLITTLDEIGRLGLAASWALAGSERRVTLACFLREMGGCPCSA